MKAMLSILLCVPIIVAAVLALVKRFSCPEMTETQILFWMWSPPMLWLSLAAFAGLIIAPILMSKDGR